MGLLVKEKNLIESNYFRVWDIIEILTMDGFNTWEEVAQFLGHHGFDTELTLFKRDSFHRINEVHGNFEPIRKLIEELNLLWLKGEEEVEKIKLDVMGYYWLKHEIYNFKPIMDLGIIKKSPTQEITTPSIEQVQPDKYKFFLYKQPLFSIDDCACIISDYDPLEIQKYSGNEIDEIAPDYSRAYSFVSSAVEAGKLNVFNYKVDADDFKKYLAEQDIQINGFNDEKYIQFLSSNSIKEQNKFNNISISASESNEEIKLLKKRIEELETVLKSKDEDWTVLAIDLKASENTIKRLNTEIELLKQLEIQTNYDESKLGSTRAENSVAKLVLVLAKMAEIDINKPHSIHESLLVQAELLGIDKFPSDETIKKWLIKANNHKNSQNPN